MTSIGLPLGISKIDSFVPTTGQTVFVLSGTPKNGIAKARVNTTSHDVGVSFGVVGNVLTWANLFLLDPLDVLIVEFEV